MTTYSQLQADVADFMARDNLTSKIPIFIRLAEPDINRRIRVIDMEADGDLVIPDTGELVLPDRFKGFISVAIKTAGDLGRNGEINYMNPDRFNEEKQNSALYSGSQRDSYYTVQSGKIKVLPAPGTGETITLSTTYRQGYSPLSAINTSNWLLTNHYDIYFCATMARANKYIMDKEAELIYRAEFHQHVDDLNNEERKNRTSGPLVRRARSAP